MEYQPLNENVIARLMEPEEKSKGGIVLSSSTKTGKPKATSLSVGPGRILNNGTCIPVTLKPGDVVVINENSFQVIEDDIVTFTENDILALIQDSFS